MKLPDRIKKVYQFQKENNQVFGEYLRHLGRYEYQVETFDELTFLPISFFKTHELKTGDWMEETIFTSSGTTGYETSKHYIKSSSVYLKACEKNFERHFTHPKEMCFLALLPAYLERKGSSLIYMMTHFISQSKYKESGFYLYNHKELLQMLLKCQKENIPTVLFGVSFALLDFAEAHQFDYPELIVMDTGGMKGRKKEMLQSELHEKLCSSFGINHISSEYGMTELNNQAYAVKAGLYENTEDLIVLPGDIYDPLSSCAYGQNARLNIIDMSNQDTMSFIATDDIGKVYENGCFEVLGRLDHSQLRGCTLLLNDQ